MKTAVIIVPMMPPRAVEPINYPVDGSKAIEYGKPVRCPANGVLAKTMKKGEEVRVIYIIAAGPNSYCDEMRDIFWAELKDINKEIQADLKEPIIVEMEFQATRHVNYKLILDLANAIPESAEIIADITYGFKTETLASICALRFAEDFRSATVQHLIYAKLETNQKTRKKENPMLYDVTSLYYLFKLMGTIGEGGADAETAMKILKDFFAI